MRKHALIVILTYLIAQPAAQAADGCSLSLSYEKSGFFMNPTLEKILVSSMKSNRKGLDCKLQAGDEILQVNGRDVKGKKAKDVMAYWKGLDQSKGLNFRVLRGNQILTLLVQD